PPDTKHQKRLFYTGVFLSISGTFWKFTIFAACAPATFKYILLSGFSFLFASFVFSFRPKRKEK
ncbi:MAG: hypothetical protein ACLSES_03000, partial [Christensenellales bacterium]